jgi:DNA-binding transcriptional ArsR family regulator
LTPTQELIPKVIDRLRKEIQDRLDQLLSEADKLRRALIALDPRGGHATPAPSTRARRSPAPSAAEGTTATPARRRSAGSGPAASTSSRQRTAPGATRKQVLDALSTNRGMTAGEVAAATGLARGTVSTTLSKLAKNGDVTKADRGYMRPQASPAS